MIIRCLLPLDVGTETIGVFESVLKQCRNLSIAVGNRLKTVPVKVARVEGENTYVAHGLNAGDMVVITRLIDPMENALLEITNKKETKS